MPLTNGTQGWGEPIATWEYSSPTPQIDFNNLSGYRDILLWADNLQHDGVGNDQPGVQLSNDNGSTHFNSNYVSAGSASTGYMVVASNAANTVPFGMRLMISDFSSTRKPKLSGVSGHLGAAVTNRMAWATRSAGPYNGLRIMLPNGSNFIAGSVHLFGKG